MSKLYEIKTEEGAVYGHKLAVNSEGLWVIEVKGGGVLTAHADKCEEVIPHSVLVSYHYTKHKDHMMCEKDKYKEGEFFFVKNEGGFSIAKIEKVDTKQPTKLEFKPFAKVNVEMIED